MKKSELNSVLFRAGVSSFRDARAEVRQGRNALTKRNHRFSNSNGYWTRYGHSGYPMQQILRIKQLFKKQAARVPPDSHSDPCDGC